MVQESRTPVKATFPVGKGVSLSSPHAFIYMPVLGCADRLAVQLNAASIECNHAPGRFRYRPVGGLPAHDAGCCHEACRTRQATGPPRGRRVAVFRGGDPPLA